jgi:hypothetical protein
MMMSQFRRGTGALGVGFALGGKGEHVYGKVGEFSGLSPSEKSSTTPKLIKITPPRPTEPTVKDRVFEEPLKAPPQKQVWVPKPNHLKNPLDTLPNISEDPLSKAKKPSRVTHTHKKVSQQPPKREVRYHCDYCYRDGHLVKFCFRRKRDERREYELNNRNMYRLFRGAMLGLEGQCRKVLGLSLRDHVVVVPGMVQVVRNMALDLMAVAFSPTALADHVFPLVVIALLKWDVACLVFFLTLFWAK